MKRSYSVSELPNPVEVLRKAGYSYFRDPQTQEESFIIRLTSEFYPRFHLYVEGTGETVTFNLHLDQKKPSYGDGNAHSGEYEGPTIEREMRRIDSWVRAMVRQRDSDTSEHDEIIKSQNQQKQLGDRVVEWLKNIFR